MCIFSKKFEIWCFPQMSRTIICFYVYIILDFPITYRNESVLCQSECPCVHKTVNMVVFSLKIMTIPTQKGEHSCKCTELSFKRKVGKADRPKQSFYTFFWRHWSAGNNAIGLMSVYKYIFRHLLAVARPALLHQPFTLAG